MKTRIGTREEVEKQWQLIWGEELFYRISGDLDFMATLHFDRFTALELKKLNEEWEELGETLFWMSERYKVVSGEKSLL